MSESFFLGVDGGGSKTIAVVSDENGRVCAHEVGESINFYSVGYERAQQNMAQLVRTIETKLGISEFESAAVGVSALFGRADEYDVKRFFGGILRSKRIIMDSDLFIALEAMDMPGACAVAISGTGSMIIARDMFGKISTKGGWGYILGDEGSGYSIAISGIKAAIRGFDGAGKKTVLSDLLLDFAEIDTLPKILDVFYDPPMERQKIAAFARHVYLAAKNGDEVAQKLTRDEAKLFAGTCIAQLSEIGGTVPVGVYGGVFENNEMFLEEFEKFLRLSYKDIEVFLLTTPPQVGALYTAYRESGIQLTDALKSNIRKTYTKFN
ncbi:MAG: hypothetical protein GX051_04910 [Clostridiales bacterium]|nr:hypothetical protein [Clostridiales bacterium]